MDHPFEIHARRNGKWKIDSVMDDRELAIAEAQQLAQRTGVEAVRVVRDAYNEHRGEFTKRTVFHASRQQEAIARDLQRRKQAEEEARHDRIAAGKLAGADRGRVERERRQRARRRFAAVLGMSTVAILAGVFGGLYLLGM